MRSLIILTFIFVIINSPDSRPNIINVPGDYSSVQSGIDAATDGDTVLVQPGIYTENINFNGRNIVVGSLFLTTDNPVYINSTVLGGTPYEDRSIKFENGEDSTALIIGFTIQDRITGVGGGIRCLNNSGPTISNNIIFNNRALSGGGIYCSGNSNPIIVDNTMTDNWAASYPGSGDGGGICCIANSNPLISGNTINNNHASGGLGGGICLKESAPIINDNIINGNIANDHGGAIYCRYSNATINGNLIRENTAYWGGGISCWNSEPVIENNEINNNSATMEGGGIRCRWSSPLIMNNTITGNEVSNSGDGQGGGVFCLDESSPTIINNLINENISHSLGGGIYCENNSNPIIKENTIDGNLAFSFGGGIYCSVPSEPTIVKNIIIRNLAYMGGGGIFCSEADPLIINNTMFGNSSSMSGGGIFCYYSNAQIMNNIFWADSANFYPEIKIQQGSPVITYCDIQGGFEGEGNIDADPLFVDPASSDFHLSWDNFPIDDETRSPCIDAGCPDSPEDPDTTCCDIGAFYFDQSGVGIDYILSLPEKFNLAQNYPNPFNASTTINYSLPRLADVTLEIYDILGRRIETLVDGNQTAGHHRTAWHAADLPSGVYFYKLTAGEYVKAEKMVLLK